MDDRFSSALRLTSHDDSPDVPSEMSEPCARLIRGLLVSSTRKRFGYKECEKHSFFSSTLGELEGFEEEEGEDTRIDFATVRSLPPPFLPELDDEDDTSYFDVRWEGNERDAKVKAEIETLIARAEKAASPQARASGGGSGGGGGGEPARAGDSGASAVGGTGSSGKGGQTSAENMMEKALGVASPVARVRKELGGALSATTANRGDKDNGDGGTTHGDASPADKSTLTAAATGNDASTPLAKEGGSAMGGNKSTAKGRKLLRSITGDDDDADVVGVDVESSAFASRLKLVRKSIRRSLEDLRRSSNAAAVKGRRAEFDDLISAHLQKQKMRKAKARRSTKLLRRNGGGGGGGGGNGRDDDASDNRGGSPGGSKSSGNLPLYWKGRKRSATADNASAMSAAAAAAATSALEVSPAQAGLLLSPVQIPMRSTSPINLHAASSKLDDSSSNLVLDTPSPPVLAMPLRSHSAMPLSRSLGSNLRTSVSPVATGGSGGSGAVDTFANGRDTSPHTPAPSSFLSSSLKTSSERGRARPTPTSIEMRLRTPAADTKGLNDSARSASGADWASLRSTSGENGDSARKATALFRAFSFDNFDALAQLNRQAVARQLEQQRQEELLEEEMLEREEEEEEEELGSNDVSEEEMV